MKGLWIVLDRTGRNGYLQGCLPAPTFAHPSALTIPSPLCLENLASPFLWAIEGRGGE